MYGSGTRKLFALSLTMLLPLALACGGGETGGDFGDEGMEGGMEGGMEETDQPMQAGGSETVSLTALGDSGVTGDVAFTRTDGTLTVDVVAENLGGPGDYPSHIHDGTCSEPGGVVVPLDNAVAHEPGVGEASTEVDANQLSAGMPYLVMVHGLQGAPVACAEVPESLVGESGA